MNHRYAFEKVMLLLAVGLFAGCAPRAEPPTSVPKPIGCNSPAVTKNLFPQLADVEGQIPFYGPVNEPKYACEAVYDIVHDKPLAVHLKAEIWIADLEFK